VARAAQYNGSHFKGYRFFLIAGGPGVELLIAFEIALIVLQSVMP